VRILQIVAQTRVGGAESFGAAIGKALALRGHSVLLLANRANGALLEGEMPERMEARALDRSSRVDPRILSFLFGALRRFRPDIIHAHNYEANTWARFLGLFAPGVGVVCHIHSSRFVTRHPRHRVWMDRLLFRRADAVIVLNEIQAEFVRTRLRVPGGRLHLIPNGIDIARFQPPAGVRGSAHQVVCVASLTEVKNHAGLLRAWAQVAVQRPEARLVLVGDGPLRPALEQQAQRDGIAGSVTFLGALSDVAPTLWESSVFVLPSQIEALPLSVLEAMAAGLGCIATRVGSIPEILDHGRTGWIVPPGDPAALAEALRDALADPQRTREIGGRAREVVRERYDLSVCRDRIEAVYATIRRKAPPSRV
jgi:glycosyltransferase involved in cell wall biosynthesis